MKILRPPGLIWALTLSPFAYGQVPPTIEADMNRDGYVSPAEADYAAALRTQFDELDRNRDGRLDPTETTGLAPAPPGAVPSLPAGAIGLAPGTVTSGRGTAGATPGTSGIRATPDSGTYGGTTGWTPAGPPSTVGPATGSPFRSPFDASDPNTGIR